MFPFVGALSKYQLSTRLTRYPYFARNLDADFSERTTPKNSQSGASLLWVLFNQEGKRKDYPKKDLRLVDAAHLVRYLRWL